MFTADQLVLHAIGDYVLQSDWMAQNKARDNVAAAAHAFTYTLPFAFLLPSPEAIAVILVTHYLIDRYRLARHVNRVKNLVGPPSAVRHMWRLCATPTGYAKDAPPFLAV